MREETSQTKQLKTQEEYTKPSTGGVEMIYADTGNMEDKSTRNCFLYQRY